MKGDKIVIEPYHVQAAQAIVPQILDAITGSEGRYTIAVAGESGSGKSETARAIANELEQAGIKAVVLGQDDYFRLPPRSNDARRRQDPEWLGPHAEVQLGLMEQNLEDAIGGKDAIEKPLVDYDSDSIGTETVDLRGVKVVLVEGTYTSLLKHLNTRVFITRNRHETLEHRKKRNRGDEVGDPFIENVLAIEHKIIAGHRQLADFLISNDYAVQKVD